MSGGLDGIVQRANDLLTVRKIGQIDQVFRQRFTGNRQAVAMHQACFQQTPDYRRQASGTVQVFLHKSAAWLQIRQQRDAVADLLKNIQRQLYVYRPGHGD